MFTIEQAIKPEGEQTKTPLFL